MILWFYIEYDFLRLKNCVTCMCWKSLSFTKAVTLSKQQMICNICSNMGFFWQNYSSSNAGKGTNEQTTNNKTSKTVWKRWLIHKLRVFKVRWTIVIIQSDWLYKADHGISHGSFWIKSTASFETTKYRHLVLVYLLPVSKNILCA